MAILPPKPCLDCGTLAAGPRCPTHAQAHAQARRAANRAYERTRSASHRAARQARTVGDGAAARLRRSFSQASACARCGAQDVALQVDHSVPLWTGGTDTDDNVQWLCVPCHQEKTAYEAAIRAIRRGK